MSSNFNPIVVVVAFNRPKSLKRILKSLEHSKTPQGTKLIISIDNNGQNQNISDMATAFNWSFGEKEVIYHKEHLGLRKHILKCGDLVYQYGSVIILEDDLYVSPHYYSYTKRALEFYDNSEKIAGISLYNLPYSESIKLPFIPVKDDSSVYFKQVTSSLGQAWSKKQWDGFKTWYSKSPDISQTEGLPYVVKRKWPESSWKKYFQAYIIETDMYFVYPDLSLTTNFNDIGTNMISDSYKGQVEVMSNLVPLKFVNIEDALNVYDAYSEICPDRLNRMCDILKEYDYEVDIYGKKDSINKPYVLTTKPCLNPILSFARSMKPHELNVVYNIEGEEISLVNKKDILRYPESVADLKNTNSIKDFIPEYNYYHTDVFDTSIMMKILQYRFIKKIKAFWRK